MLIKNHMIKMKIAISLTIVFSIITLGYLYLSKNRAPSPQYQYEKTTHAHYMRKTRSIDKKSIVFLGSSSIQGLNVSQIAKHSINLGIGGERIEGLINRVQEYFQLPQSRLIVIAAGFKDLSHSNTLTMSKQFNLLIQKLNNVPLVISALQPATNLMLCENLATKIVQFNLYLQDTCHNLKQCYFVDLPKILTVQSKPFFEIDDVHLNKLGYQLWQTELSDAIKRALNTTQGSNSIR